MHTITSKQLYDLIISEKLNVKLVTSRHFNAVGMADIIEKEDVLFVYTFGGMWKQYMVK